jgi:type II secretory pathway pseudopilin PulG
MTPSLRKSFPARQSAFSLVEVVLAVGVVAFAFVAILGLIPAGLTQFRQATDTSVGAQIAQRVIEDAEQSDFNTLIDYNNTVATNSGTITTQPLYFRAPSVADTTSATAANPGPCVRYFDESGNEIIPAARTTQNLNVGPSPIEQRSIVYWVNTRILVATQVPQPSTATKAYLPSLATVLVQVAYNPGNLPLPVYAANVVPPSIPMGFDVSGSTSGKPLPGVSVRNYTAQVGRNF